MYQSQIAQTKEVKVLSTWDESHFLTDLQSEDHTRPQMGQLDHWLEVYCEDQVLYFLNTGEKAISIRTSEHVNQPYRPTQTAPQHHWSNLQVVLVASAPGTEIASSYQGSRCCPGKLFDRWPVLWWDHLWVPEKPIDPENLREEKDEKWLGKLEHSLGDWAIIS